MSQAAQGNNTNSGFAFKLVYKQYANLVTEKCIPI